VFTSKLKIDSFIRSINHNICMLIAYFVFFIKFNLVIWNKRATLTGTELHEISNSIR